MTTLLATTGLAILTSIILTPLVRWAATRLDIVDRPDRQRKVHERAVPLGGGVVVLVSLTVAVLAAVIVPNPWQDALWAKSPFLIGLFLSAVVLCAVGLLDDRTGLRGRQKLAGQVVAVCILMASGLIIEDIRIFDWSIHLGLLALPFTLFWLLGAINALNLIDGMDGLATSVGIILSLAVAGMALLTGHHPEAVVAFAIAGSLIGFLRYNFPPASIFLGDAGSMLIGLIVGALAIRASLKGPATVALAAPTAIWAIPIFDVSMAILRRKLTGRSLYYPDRGHLHHRLKQRGYSGRKTVLVIGVFCVCTAVGALLSVYNKNEFLALGGAAAALGTLVLAGLFGQTEGLLLCRRMKATAVSVLRLPQKNPRNTVPLCTQLQGDREWDDLWSTLVEFADRFDVSSLQLNVTLPALQEDYHATWQRRVRDSETELWRTDIPLISNCVAVGRLQIAGVCNGESACTWMGELIAGLKPFETQMLTLLEEHMSEEHTLGHSDKNTVLQPVTSQSA